MGRARIYWNDADKQAAYRRRKAGWSLDTRLETFDKAVLLLRRLVEDAPPSEISKTSLLALVDAVGNRDGYRQWKVELQRRAF